MKKILASILFLCLALPAFAQVNVPASTAIPVEVLPSFTPYALSETGLRCFNNLADTPYKSYEISYRFASAVPSVVLMTAYGTTGVPNATASGYSSIGTGTDTAGGKITISEGGYTGICIKATTLTGTGVQVKGSFVGIAPSQTTGGGGGGTTQDSDDGTVAGAQTADLGIAVTYVYDGSNWKRLTVGTAGTASSQVLTVQGIASMTPFLVNPGTAANFGIRAEDVAETDGLSGVVVLGVRRDTAASSAGTTGDYATFNFTSDGALWIKSAIVDAADNAAVATAPVPIGGVFVTSPTSLDSGDVGYPLLDAGHRFVLVGAGTAGTAAGGVLSVQGVASMTPLLVTLSGTNSLPTGASTAAKQPALGTAGTASADVITVQGIASMTPLLATVTNAGTFAVQPAPGIGGGSLVSGTITSAMTGTTSTSLVGGTASNYLYITQCTVSNGSTTVSTDILLQDGSGGTTLYVLPAPAASVATTGGGGAAVSFPIPLKVPTSGNALFAANVTTGSSTKASCSGFKSTTSY